MASTSFSISMGICKALLVVTLLFSNDSFSASAFDFVVGDGKGWVVPSSKNSDAYNEWASKNRFKIGDTVVFKYEKDSVMAVAEEDYEECNSAHPTFFSNNGRTEFRLDHAGTFYFISGVAGHCHRGQKMIVRVLGHSAAAPPPPGGSSPTGNHSSGGATPPPPGDHSGAAGAVAAAPFFSVLLVAASFCFSSF